MGLFAQQSHNVIYDGWVFGTHSINSSLWERLEMISHVAIGVKLQYKLWKQCMSDPPESAVFCTLCYALMPGGGWVTHPEKMETSCWKPFQIWPYVVGTLG